MSDDRKPSPTEYRQTPRSMAAVRPSPPPQPKTAEMPAVKVPSTQMDELLSLTKATNEAVRNIGNEVAEINAWKNGMEEWKEGVNARLGRNSDRAKNESNHDLEQDAAIAAEVQRRLKLEQDATDIQRRVVGLEGSVAIIRAEVSGNKAMMERVDKAVSGFLSNPKVKFLGAVIWMLITGYLAKKGLEVPR